METLKEQMKRLIITLENASETPSSPRDTPVSTTPETLAEKREAALDRLFTERVPDAYRECSIGKVSQLQHNGIFRGKGIFLTGNPGIGKTYAATAIARMLIRRRFYVKPDPAQGEIVYPARALIWTTSPRFMTRVRATNSSKARESALDVMEEFDRAFVVVLDDYGAEKPSDYAAETLYDMLTGRLNNNRFTVITTNLTTTEVAEWRPSMASRLAELNKVVLPDRDWRLIKRYQCA